MSNRGGSLSVLVVDDSAAARMLAGEALREWTARLGLGLAVTEAVDGFDALTKLPRGRFDLLLTDINMPTLSGLELIRMVRARPENRSLPVIAISTERLPDDARRATEAGADGYLTKPFDLGALGTLLDRLLPDLTRARPSA